MNKSKRISYRNLLLPQIEYKEFRIYLIKAFLNSLIGLWVRIRGFYWIEPIILVILVTITIGKLIIITLLF